MKKKKLLKKIKLLQESNHELVELNKLKSESIANIGHELKTPLNSIIGFSSLMSKNKSSNLDEKQLKYINSINKNGLKLLDIISQTIELNKIEAGQMELKLEEIDIFKTISNLVILMQVQADEKAIVLNLKNKLQNQMAISVTDAQRVKQIIMQLISYSLKYIDRSSGIIKIILSQNSKYNIICVQDNTNINKDNINELSIGMKIIKNIVKKLDGKIKSTFEESKGNDFAIYLPRKI